MTAVSVQWLPIAARAEDAGRLCLKIQAEYLVRISSVEMEANVEVNESMSAGKAIMKWRNTARLLRVY